MICRTHFGVNAGRFFTINKKEVAGMITINRVFALSLILGFMHENALALTRRHEYIVTVVNGKQEPLKDITVKTLKVSGYDQESASCITSAEGRCSLKFTAFSPVNTVVTVKISSADESLDSSPAFTLPAVKNSFFSNNDSVQATLTFDIDSIRVKRQRSKERQRSWELETAPHLSEFVNTEIVKMPEFVALRSKSMPQKISRDKFETDEEYNARKKKLSSVFVYLDLTTTEESRCKSNYLHGESIYKLSCRFDGEDQAITTYRSQGEALVLSNAYDQRTISRVMYNKVFMPLTFEWVAEYRLDKNVARALDNDLAIGFLGESSIDVKASCALCESRDRQDASDRTLDNINKLSESMSVLTGRPRSYTPRSKGWKDDAFREGSILEDWNYVIDAGSIRSLIIFKKSDKKVLMKMDIN